MAAVTARRKTTSAEPASDAAGDDDGTVDAPGVAVDKGAPWMAFARDMIGLNEAIGKRSNPKVVALFAEVGHPEIRNSIATPWCAAYTGASLERAGYPSTKSLMARSYEKYGVPSHARVGAILTFWRGKSDDGVTGHVGFYVGEDATHYHVLGGNQEDSVCIERIRKSRCTSIRWPRKPSGLGTVQAAVAAGTVGAATSGAQIAAEVLTPSEPVALDMATKLQEPMRELAMYFRWAAIAAAVLGVVIAVYIAWRRIRDFKARGV